MREITLYLLWNTIFLTQFPTRVYEAIAPQNRCSGVTAAVRYNAFRVSPGWSFQGTTTGLTTRCVVTTNTMQDEGSDKTEDIDNERDDKPSYGQGGSAGRTIDHDRHEQEEEKGDEEEEEVGGCAYLQIVSHWSR